MLQRWFQESQTPFWDHKRDPDDSGSSFGRLPYQLWNVNKYGSCADAAVTGIMPPPLMELQVIMLCCLILTYKILVTWMLPSCLPILGRYQFVKSLVEDF